MYSCIKPHYGEIIKKKNRLWEEEEVDVGEHTV